MKEIFSVVTNNENETMMVGEKLAKVTAMGTVITLTGDLGAGKTHFVKGFVRGMESDNLVTSPTFTLLNVYESGKMPVYHFDMYRLSSKEEAEELGFNEYFDISSLDGVTIVEWPEQVAGLIDMTHLEIKIEKLEGDKRKLTLSSVGGE